MITFEFLNSQRAAESLVPVPSFQLVTTLEGDWFEIDYEGMTSERLPENFYLQEAANLSPKAGIDEVFRFVQRWGRPAKADFGRGRIVVPTSQVKRELATLAQFGRFATDWFESEKQLLPPDPLLRLIERSLAVFHPRLDVGGSRNTYASAFSVSVAQWADDAVNQRLLRVCDFCGQRFTKQRGRSTSGRYRTDEQTKFCSHSCANRAGNRRRRTQGRTT